MAFKILDKQTAETIHETNNRDKALKVARNELAKGKSVMILERLPNTRFIELKLAS